MSSLILLRHGQASFGAPRYDSLSDLGREQALATGRYWGQTGARFTRAWVGPRDRHRDTARLVLETLGTSPETAAEDSLDEFAEGQQILGSAQKRTGIRLHGDDALTGTAAARLYAAEIDAWAAAEVEIEGARSAARFRQQVADWLTRATAAPEPDQRVLAVTSGGVIAAAVAIVLDLPDSRMAEFMRVIRNASITELAFSSGRRPALVSFNVAAHLGEALSTRI